MNMSRSITLIQGEGDPVYNLLCVKTVIVDSSPTLSRHSLKALFITILGNSVDGTLQKVREPIYVNSPNYSTLVSQRSW